jgi:hypothetical protein
LASILVLRVVQRVKAYGRPEADTRDEV